MVSGDGAGNGNVWLISCLLSEYALPLKAGAISEFFLATNVHSDGAAWSRLSAQTEPVLLGIIDRLRRGRQTEVRFLIEPNVPAFV